MVGLTLATPPESHVIINGMVVFSHSALNGDEDQPCHTVPPYSRYSVSGSLGLYQRDFPANTRMLSLRLKEPSLKFFVLDLVLLSACKYSFI